MSLITDYTKGGSGRLISYDVAISMEKWSSKSGGTLGDSYEYDMNRTELSVTTEWFGLSASAAQKLVASKRSAGFIAFSSYASDAASTLLEFKRTPHYQVREDNRVVGSYVVTGTTVTSIVGRNATQGGAWVAFGLANGGYTFPQTCAVTGGKNADNYVALYDLYSDSLAPYWSTNFNAISYGTITIQKPTLAFGLIQSPLPSFSISNGLRIWA